LRAQHPSVATDQTAPRIAAPRQQSLTDEQIRQRYLDSLLQVFGLAPEMYSYAVGPTVGSALAAGNAFERVRETNKLLAQKLAERDEQVRRDFDDVYKAQSVAALSMRESGHAERCSELLNESHEELQRRWPMLMPEGPYEVLIAHLFEQLEKPAGNGNLYAQEGELLRLLRNLKAQLAASPRRNSDDWHRLEKSFQVDAMGDQTVVAFGQTVAKGGQR
jgi:hypothetical protein